MKLRRPTPALVVALVALFMSLSGTALAAGVMPLAKRALFAYNAGQLQGKSAKQIAAIPGPASSATVLVSRLFPAFTLAPGEKRTFTAHCPLEERAIGGGWETQSTPKDAVVAASSRTTDGETAWTLLLMNLSKSTSATGLLEVLCLQ